MAPAMGPPMRTPNDKTEKARPVRVPISGKALIWATQEGKSDRKAPERKPKMPVKAIIPPEVVTGIQIAKPMIEASKATRIMTLKRPILSASIPGKMRPKMLIFRSHYLSEGRHKKNIGLGRQGKHITNLTALMIASR